MLSNTPVDAMKTGWNNCFRYAIYIYMTVSHKDENEPDRIISSFQHPASMLCAVNFSMYENEQASGARMKMKS